MSALLYGVSPLDAVTYVTVAAGLGATALVASYLPAIRAAKVDPAIALRYEL
jgi:putative ABC transport system permease protein